MAEDGFAYWQYGVFLTACQIFFSTFFSPISNRTQYLPSCHVCMSKKVREEKNRISTFIFRISSSCQIIEFFMVYHGNLINSYSDNLLRFISSTTCGWVDCFVHQIKLIKCFFDDQVEIFSFDLLSVAFLSCGFSWKI